MPEPTSGLPARPSLEQLRKQAKDLLRAIRTGDPTALVRAARVIPRLSAPSAVGDIALSDAQFILAREYGFEHWPALVHHVASIETPRVAEFEQLAASLAAAYRTGHAMAIREINWGRGTSFRWDRDPEPMRARLRTWYAADPRDDMLALADAKGMVARQYGADSWDEFVESLPAAAPDPRAWARDAGGASSYFIIDEDRHALVITRPLVNAEWDAVAATLVERALPTLLANGNISNDGLARLAPASHLLALDIGGSERLTDDGMRHLRAFQQLERLDMGGWKTKVTDHGLKAVGELRRLRRFTMPWAQRISDRGGAVLASCSEIEYADLMGTDSGDGTIAALSGKPNLHTAKLGTRCTDRGLERLPDFPLFARWAGGEPTYGLMRADAGPTHLMIGGPFTSRGFEWLRTLDGLFGLSLSEQRGAQFSSDAFKVLPELANLGFVALDGRLCDDRAMAHFAVMPRLRMLLAQDAVATDTGYAALSASTTLEYIWARGCLSLGSRGFRALAGMRSLLGLALCLRHVDDAALALLPTMPALREVVPMDVSDDAFRHVGGCAGLERLWCMYCRETGDAATAWLASLSQLRTYYAGATRITDRSLDMLADRLTIEVIELWDCPAVTDAGVAALARLPNLRSVSVEGSPDVTRSSRTHFKPGVRVRIAG